MHHQNYAFGSEAYAGDLHGEDDASAHRERRSRSQITTSEAQVGELAGSGRIVLLKLRSAALEPRVQAVAHGGSQIQEAQPNLSARILPSHFTRTLDVVFGSGQRELQLDGSEIFRPVCKLDRHAAFADVTAHCAHLAGPVIHLDGNRSLNGNAGIAATFALHQGAYGAKTGFGTFSRKRLVQDKMGPQVSRTSQRGLGANDRDRHCPLVAWGGAGAAQHARGRGRVCAIHNDCFKPPAGQFVNGGFGIGAKLHTDFQLTQYPPQNANNLLVGTKNQRLSTHKTLQLWPLAAGFSPVRQLPRLPRARRRASGLRRGAVPPRSAELRSACLIAPALPVSYAAPRRYPSQFWPPYRTLGRSVATVNDRSAATRYRGNSALGVAGLQAFCQDR